MAYGAPMRSVFRSFVFLLLPAAAMAQSVSGTVPGTAVPPSPTAMPQPLRLEAAPPHTAYPPVVPASSPLRRVAPADSRLTCEDYSLSYFSRHPAMAAVCGVDVQAEQAERAAAAAAMTASSSTQP